MGYNDNYIAATALSSSSVPSAPPRIYTHTTALSTRARCQGHRQGYTHSRIVVHESEQHQSGEAWRGMERMEGTNGPNGTQSLTCAFAAPALPTALIGPTAVSTGHGEAWRGMKRMEAQPNGAHCTVPDVCTCCTSPTHQSASTLPPIDRIDPTAVSGETRHLELQLPRFEP